MEFYQVYDPLGHIWLSALVALSPIALFFISLIVFKLKGYSAGFLSLALSILIALFVYKMPVQMVSASFFYGFLYGLWPIAWIVIAAIFLYNLSVKSGYFEILKESILSLTPDHRILVILIGFCFGSFLEGAIGFGGPVAIANTAPVAFGAVGIPITAMASVVGIPELEISQMVGRVLPIFSIGIPFFIVFLMDGFRGIRETFPAVAVTGFSFAIAQFLSSNYLGPQLPDIISALVSLVATTLFLKFWQPKHIFTSNGKEPTISTEKHHICKVVVAWMPFVLLTITIIIWTQPWFKALFKEGGALAFSSFAFEFNSISQKIFKTVPIVTEATNFPVVFKLPLILTTGTSIFLAALLSVFLLRVKISDAIGVFGATLKEMRLPILTIGVVLAFAYVANYSGMSATLALALADTGHVFTFFSPVVGWLGDTSSNLLFGSLQMLIATQLGLPEVLFLAANTSGGVVGKMISPQSIAIACAAVGLVGKESELFRFTVKYSIALAIIMGIVFTLIAYVFPFIIPVTPT
ncbi:L-lactate permease [Helicobacter pylori 908]|nr:L-lactate permease [Helicobacter pylori 908]